MQAVGAEYGLSFVEESVFNTTPDTPSMLPFRKTDGVNIDAVKQALESAELRSDRQISVFRHGNRSVQGRLPFELSFLSFDDPLEACLMGTWANGVDIAATDISVIASDNSYNSTTTNFVTDGVVVGDVLTVAGFTTSGNNGAATVATVAANKITVTGLTLGDEAAGDSITMVSARTRLKPAKTFRSFTFEERFTDIGKYFAYTGNAFSAMDLNIAPNTMVTGSFTLMGAGFSAGSGTSLGAPAAEQTTDPMDSFTGILKEGGAELAIVTALTLNLDNRMNVLPVVGSQSARGIDKGRSRLTGTLSAYFESEALVNKFINETESSLVVNLGDPAGNFHRLTMPRVKYNGGSKPVQGEGAIVLNMPFIALRDATETVQFVYDAIPA